MTVFDIFQEQPYTYLQIARGKFEGNVIVSETNLSGIFKERQSQETTGNIELYNSSSTLHVHPEDYANIDEIIGNGVRVDGKEYEITNMTRGTNFDNGVVEHLTFTLQRASLTDGTENN